MTELKIFSPSAIKVYSECPIKYELQYLDKVVPKVAGNAFYGLIAGKAFSKGIDTWYKNGHCLGDATIAGTTKLLADIHQFTEAGGQVESETVEHLVDDIETAIKKFTASDPFALWTEIQTEVSLPAEYGNPRLDIIGRNQYGTLSFADIKFKRYLDTKYVDKTVEEYRYDWQFLHYQWAMEQHYKEPINAYLCLVRLKSAWQAQLFEFVYKPELIRSVGLSAKRWSESINTTIDRGAAIGTTHDTKYGPCPYKEACLKYQWDEILMRDKYITLKETDESKI